MKTGKVEYEVKKTVEDLLSYTKGRISKMMPQPTEEEEKRIINESELIAKHLFPSHTIIIDKIYN